MLVYLAMIPTEEGRNKFALLYWEYRDLMFYLALRILGSQQDAEDAVQEALLRITEIIEKIHDPVCPETKALVGMIVEGKALDLYRRRRRAGGGAPGGLGPGAGRPPPGGGVLPPGADGPGHGPAPRPSADGAAAEI